MLSYVYAIFAAEYVLGLLPRGTHDWNKFISPEEIERLLAPGDSCCLIRRLNEARVNNFKSSFTNTHCFSSFEFGLKG